MREFQDGEVARVLRHGIEVEVVVFRQLGELIYVFDKKNRPYQFHVRDVLPARSSCTDTTEPGMSFSAEHTEAEPA